MSKTPSKHFSRMFSNADEGLNFYINRMNANMKSAPDNRLIIHDSPLKLQLLALRKVAANLVADELINLWIEYEPYARTVWGLRLWDKAFNVKRGSWDWDIDWSHFTKTIADQIWNEMLEIPYIFYRWLSNHENVLDNMMPNSVFELLPELVWRPDGRVDYLQTNLKLILGTKLSDREKFKFMCVCCMEHDIGELYKTKYWTNLCKKDKALKANEHVQYWHCHFTGDEPSFPEEYEDLEDIVYSSYLEYLLEKPTLNLMALDYYFTVDCKTPDEKYHFCTADMEKFDSFDVKYLLAKLSHDEQAKLLESHIFHIMHTFFVNTRFHFALQLWNHVKDSMSGDQFIEMMRTLILRIDKNKWDLKDSVYETRRFSDFAQDLWKSTPAHLKKLFFQHQNGALIFNWKQWFGNHFHKMEMDSVDHMRDDSLLLAIVSDADAEFRREFWKREWPKLITGIQPELLRQFMTVHSRDSGRLLCDSKAMCEYLKKLFIYFRFDDLNSFLDILASDPTQRKLWKSRIIGQPAELIFDQSQLNDLSTFFQDVDEQSKVKFLFLWIDKLHDVIPGCNYGVSIHVHRDEIIKVVHALSIDIQKPALKKFKSLLYSS